MRHGHVRTGFVLVCARIVVVASIVGAGTVWCGACARQHLVDPEVVCGVGSGTVGNIRIEHLLEVACRGIESDAGARKRPP